MVQKLKDYRPKEVVFALSDDLKNQFPTVLFDGAKKVDEVLKSLNENFVCVFPDGRTAKRLMDAYEKSETRDSYCELTENELPNRVQELEDAINEAKALKKNAEDRLEDMRRRIAELAAEVKAGVRDIQLPKAHTVRIAINGYFLFYAWIDGKFQLCDGYKIPKWERQELWSQEEKNVAAMRDLFGYSFPAPEKPKGNDGEDDDKENDDELTDSGQ